MAQMTPEDIIRQALVAMRPDEEGLAKQETERPSSEISEPSVMDKVRSHVRNEEKEKAARIRSKVGKQKARRNYNLDKESELAGLEDAERQKSMGRREATPVDDPSVPNIPGAQYRVDSKTAEDMVKEEEEGIAEGKRQDRDAREVRYQKMLDDQINEAAKEGRPDNMSQEEYRESIRRNAMRNINQARASKTRGEQERDFEQQEEDYQEFRGESDARIAEDEERMSDMKTMDPADYFRKYGDEASADVIDAGESHGAMLEGRTSDLQRENEYAQSLLDGIYTPDQRFQGAYSGGHSVDPDKPAAGASPDMGPGSPNAIRAGEQAIQDRIESELGGVHPMATPLPPEAQARKDAAEAAIPEGMKRYKGGGADLGRLMTDEDYEARMAENRIRTEKNRAKRKAYADQERYYKKHLRPGEFAFQTWGMPGSAASQFGQALAQQYGAMMQAPGQAQLARDKMASDERIAGIQAGDADEKRNTNMLAMYQMLATQAAALPVGHPSRKAIEAQMAAISAQIMGGGSSGGGVPNWLTPALPGRGGQGGGSQGGDGTLDISNYDYWPEDHMNNAWLEAGGDVRPALDDISEELDGTEMGDSGFLGDDAFDDMVDWMWDLGVLINEGTVTQENLPLVMHHLKSKMSPTVWNYLTTEQFGKPLDPEHGEWVGGYDTEEIKPAHIEFMKAIMSGKLPTSQQIQAIQKEGWFWS